MLYTLYYILYYIHYTIYHILHWQTKCLSGILISSTDRQNVCQAMNFVHWQTKCLSGNEFRPLTDKMSVTYLKFIHWQTKHLSKIRVHGWALVLLTDISSVSDTEKSKNLRTKLQIHWLTDPILSSKSSPRAFCMHWQTFILSINEFKLTDRRKVCQWWAKSEEQWAKSEGTEVWRYTWALNRRYIYEVSI